MHVSRVHGAVSGRRVSDRRSVPNQQPYGPAPAFSGDWKATSEDSGLKVETSRTRSGDLRQVNVTMHVTTNGAEESEFADLLGNLARRTGRFPQLVDPRGRVNRDARLS